MFRSASHNTAKQHANHLFEKGRKVVHEVDLCAVAFTVLFLLLILLFCYDGYDRIVRDLQCYNYDKKRSFLFPTYCVTFASVPILKLHQQLLKYYKMK